MDLMHVLMWILIVLMLVFIGFRRYKKGNLMAVVWIILGGGACWFMPGWG